MQTQLKYATLEELAAIIAFRQELYAQDPSALNTTRDLKTLQELLKEPALGRAWFVMVDGERAGCVIVTYCFSVEFAGRFALIDELFLAPSFRGRGVGSWVLAEVERRLRGEGIAAIRLEVERSNVGAEKLYRRYGFEPHDRHLMTKWLNR